VYNQQAIAHAFWVNLKNHLDAIVAVPSITLQSLMEDRIDECGPLA
jgi:hypothetical protein